MTDTTGTRWRIPAGNGSDIPLFDWYLVGTPSCWIGTFCRFSCCRHQIDPQIAHLKSNLSHYSDVIWCGRDSTVCLTVYSDLQKTTHPYWWTQGLPLQLHHYSGVIIMSTIASQITGVSIVYSTVCSGENQRKHQSRASLVFVRGIHRWQVTFPAQRGSNALLQTLSIWISQAWFSSKVRPIYFAEYVHRDVLINIRSLSWIVLFINDRNPGYFSLAAIVLNPQQILMFIHISARFGGRQWHPQTSEQ